MSRVYPRSSILFTVIAAVLPFASPAQATGSLVTQPAHVRPQARVRISTAYELPGDRVYPEGIAADPHSGDLYCGSYVDGTVFKMTPGNRAAEVFLPAGADGRSKALGLEVDRAGRLWVIDADTGVTVYDIRSRRLLARFDVPGRDPRLVNDLAVTPDGSVYLTDSLRAVVYRVTPRQLAQARTQGGHAPLTPAFDLTGILEPHPPGTVTLNGIVAHPSGRYLLTVDMNGGDLYRINPSTGDVHKVGLRDHDMSQADGMELRNGTLWVAHPIPGANAISRWRLDPDGGAARMERRLTDQALRLPTTLIRRHGKLYVVRSQFDKGGPVGPGTPQTPFTIASVEGI
ncbi:SMP-30/gluconolactonase/LRE family protein [Microbispora sp. NPDC049125]|uniref:SMP-30/gluconolactonase/LRE family protein n=1 Tax=Microbispora sp. NPDC049125 TaxID=3154929 RepID=UPI003466DE54